MRIINLDRDGQRVEIRVPGGVAVATFRKRPHGGWRLELCEYPDGLRVQTLTDAPESK
jgi:hypothetical protein